MDSRIFILYFGLECNPTSFSCSNCPSSDHWDLCQLAHSKLDQQKRAREGGIFLLSTFLHQYLWGFFIFVEHVPIFWCYKMLQAHLIYFFLQVLCSVKSPGSFYWKMISEDKICKYISKHASLPISSSTTLV